MDLKDLNELDLNNVGDWPIVIKAIVVALLCIAVAFAVYYFHTSKQLDALDLVEQEEQELRATFEEKQQKATNLDAYKQQLEEMRESFGAMLRQLPDRTEVAALLVDVSQTGLAAGLEFELFKPADDANREFYAELPIRMKVLGRYHEFGRFISGLAALPRIVTIHDVEIQPTRGGRRGRSVLDAGERLSLSATVKTYRYLDEDG